jgi:methanogenic corrinoid protein MtbC1
MTDSSAHDASIAEVRSRLDAALAHRDRPAAVSAALEAVREGKLGVSELYTRVLSPLLIDTGAAWQAGTTRVWEEHYASAIVRTIVEALYPEVARMAAAVPSRGQHVLLANPPRELHDLGLRMLADRFELAGYSVTFLGADTPLNEIAAAAHATRADLVVLSASTVYERVELRELLETLRAKVPGCRIRVGGAAFARDKDWPKEDILNLEEFGLPDSTPEGSR